MMSETSARASRFARWFGSFDRKGLSGRRAPPSETGDDAAGGVLLGRGGSTGRDGCDDGTKGDGPDVAGGPPGMKGGTGGGGENSGRPDAGEGGVWVAIACARSPASARLRGAAGASTDRGGGKGDGAERGPGAAALGRPGGPLNGVDCHPLCAGGADGVDRARSCDAGSGGVAVRWDAPVGVV